MKIILTTLLLVLSFSAQADSPDGKAILCENHNPVTREYVTEGYVFKTGKVAGWTVTNNPGAPYEKKQVLGEIRR